MTLVLAGCSNDPGDEIATQTPTNPVATTAPTPTTDAPTDASETTTAAPELSDEEQDRADVEATLQAFNAALARATTGEESIEGIYPFSRDTAREQWVTEVMAAEAQGITFTGGTDLEVLEVMIDEETAEAVACADVSAVEAVDEDGESVIADDRLDETLKDFVLERDDSAELGWYIVDDTNRNEPCDG
ncbi:hypothetical protein [Ornithinimicrobium sediminis]|uniref:hypothetical protein n=1 Tax=Ornithinimicrobium sediminis TaxID=2904603 RepID=UPI001E4CFB6B|nr:hypothetical protein [Ornithinimicrobium sediminis]MCE0485495.1 hypothetical protein [Ornithinimicrobium sediminis]